MSDVLTGVPNPRPAGLFETIEAAGYQVSSVGDGSEWLVGSGQSAAVMAIVNSYVGGAAQLAYAQAQAQAALGAQYEALVAAGCTIQAASGTNYTMALDTASLMHYDAEALAAAMAGQSGVPAWDTSEFWLAADGLTQVAMPTAAAALSAALTIRGYYKALVKQAATLGAQIATATSVSAVAAVNIAAGWPAQPA
jgi:hypothetical protein